MKTFCQKVFAKRFHFAHNSNHVSHGAIHLIIISPHGAGMLFAVLVRASRLSVSSRARAIIALSFAEPTRTVAAERVQAQVDCCKTFVFSPVLSAIGLTARFILQNGLLRAFKSTGFTMGHGTTS